MPALRKVQSQWVQFRPPSPARFEGLARKPSLLPHHRRTRDPAARQIVGALEIPQAPISTVRVNRDRSYRTRQRCLQRRLHLPLSAQESKRNPACDRPALDRLLAAIPGLVSNRRCCSFRRGYALSQQCLFPGQMVLSLAQRQMRTQNWSRHRCIPVESYSALFRKESEYQQDRLRIGQDLFFQQQWPLRLAGVARQ